MAAEGPGAQQVAGGPVVHKGQKGIQGGHRLPVIPQGADQQPVKVVLLVVVCGAAARESLRQYRCPRYSAASLRSSGIRTPMTVSGGTVGISLAWKAWYSLSCRANSLAWISCTAEFTDDFPSFCLTAGDVPVQRTVLCIIPYPYCQDKQPPRAEQNAVHGRDGLCRALCTMLLDFAVWRTIMEIGIINMGE